MSRSVVCQFETEIRTPGSPFHVVGVMTHAPLALTASRTPSEAGEPHDDLVDHDVVRDLDSGDLAQRVRELARTRAAPVDELGDARASEALERGPDRERASAA